MSMLTGVLTGMLKQANSITRQKAIQAREDEIYKMENRESIGRALVEGTIAGTVSPATYTKFDSNPDATWADIMEDVVADRRAYDEAIKNKEVLNAGYAYLDNLIEQGIVPAEEKAELLEQGAGIDKIYDTGSMYVEIADREDAYEAGVKAKTELLENKDIRKNFKGFDLASLVYDSRFTKADLLSMSMNMNKTAGKNILRYGNAEFEVFNDDYQKNVRSGDELKMGINYLEEMTRIVRNPNLRDVLFSELTSNPDALASFDEDIAKFANYYIGGSIKAGLNPVTGVISSYVLPEDNFKDLFKFVKEVGSDNIHLSNDHSNKIIKEQAQKNGDIENTSQSVVFNYVDREGVSQSDVMEFSEGDYGAASRIASALNLRSVQELFDNFQFVRRADTPEEAYTALLQAIEFEKLNVNAFNEPGGADENIRFAVGERLVLSYGSNRLQMAQAIMPLMTVEFDQKGKRGAETTLEPVAVYLKKYLDIDVNQVTTQYEATEQTLSLLTELMDKVADEETPTGFAAKLRQFASGLLGADGQLQQLLGNNTDDVSAQEVLTRARDLGFFDTDVIENLSEIDSLKLTLAAQMARAVDPSGRLSNQDFEVQLQRLQGSRLFSSKTQAKTALKVVIDDFNKRREKLVGIYELATELNEFGVKEQRLFKAHQVIDKSITQYRRGLYTGQTSRSAVDSDTSPVGVLSPQPTNDGGTIYQDEDGNYFEDEDGKKPLSGKEGLSRITGQSI